MNFEDFKKLTPEQRILLEQSEKTPEERVVIEQLRQQLEQEIQEGLKNFIHADHQIDLIIDRVHLENTETIDRIKQEDQVQQQLDILNQLASEEMQKIEEKLQEITLSPEVLKKQNELINALSNGYISNVQNIINMGILSPEHLSKFYKTPEVITATEQGLVHCLSNGNISDAQNIINLGILSPEHLSKFYKTPEVITATEQGLVNRLSNIWISSAQDIIDMGILPEEKIITATERQLVNCLSNGYISNVQNIINMGILSPEHLSKFYKTPEVITATEQRLVNCLSNGNISYAQDIINMGILSPEHLSKFYKTPEVITATEQGLKNCLSKGNLSDARNIINMGILSPEHLSEFYKTPEVITATEQGLKNCLSKGNLSDARNIINMGILSPEHLSEFYKTPEVITATEQGLKNCLSNGNISSAQNIINMGILSPKHLKTPEIITATEQGLVHCLSKGSISDAQDIINMGILPEDKIITATEQGLKNCFSEGSISYAQDIINMGILPEEKIITLTEQGLVNLLSNGNISYAQNIINLGILPEEKIITATEQGLKNCLSNGNISYAQDIINLGILPEEKIITATEQGLKNCLSNGNISSAQNIINLGILSPEHLSKFYKTPEVITATEQGLMNCLFNGYISNVQNIINLGILLQEKDNFGQIKNMLQSKYFNIAQKSIVMKNIMEMNYEEFSSQQEIIKKEKQDRLIILSHAEQFIQNPETCPGIIKEKKKKFHEKFGKKGESLFNLAMTVYDTEDESSFIKKMEHIEKIISTYKIENIPPGAQSSIGIEYEVGISIVTDYNAVKGYSYIADMQKMSNLGNIKKGNDAQWEIATRPTINPYILIAEIKLLQDAGMIDFNFETYKNASRGCHMSLGGESGLYANSSDMNFLQNILTMSGYSGLLIGKEVSSVKNIYSKSLEGAGITTAGERVEFKGMGGDSFEQFEKTIITSHNIAIAAQVAKKYEQNNVFQTKQEEYIVFAYKKLQNEVQKAVDLHNKSFLEIEFSGDYIDSNGEYREIDTLGTAFTSYASKRKQYFGTDTIDWEKESSQFIVQNDVLKPLQPETVNAITRANNLIIFKKSILPSEYFSDSKILKDEYRGNSHIFLDTMKSEQGDTMTGKPQESIFDRDGKSRDGYYALQGTSPEMITHKLQIIINHFNNTMDLLINHPDRELLESTTSSSYAVV